ncbi:N-acetyltransferase [Nitrosospira lacus]|uniref:GNAT family N-acetyltransferase n=1 Tax=Nitrosospira lacus TaxID=1288494 RepID=A0A1W6SL20_9PROT|nr:GNAT family N-acetyltransferase [Nitrosospira lacus]ARO86494.1 N-acetyltransferase [Nitrosospira lacus]
MIPEFEVKVIDSLDGISVKAWNALAGDDPFLRHEFFSAMHDTGCASRATGWLPQFVTLWEGNTLRGALPLYLKNHSYGEYVFDWAWADAYRRAGHRYYPKLLSAVPFSPVTGRRLLAETPEHRALLVSAALKMAKSKNAETGVSSFHCLFPREDEAREMELAGMTLRHGIQFHWKNRDAGGYAHFEAFLGELSHGKRKKIRQERRKVHAEGIRFQWLSGHDANPDHWRFFVNCYNKTYRNHHSMPYLNLEFFLRLGKSMPENVLLILALRDDQPVAAALNLHNSRTLYGRYWGTMEFVPGLHFETCYYQAIEFCIAHCIALFEGGAQGEHKLARGFLPVRVWSAHWLAHPEFAAAIGKYLKHEAQDINHYLDELNESSPFKKEMREK